MALKKTNLIMGAFIIFWIVLIGWGMLKTGLKLFQPKPPAMPTGLQVATKEAPQEIIPPRAPEPSPVQAETRAIMVRTFRAKATDFQDVLPVMGTVKGKTEVELRFEISGVVKKIYFREGEKIKKGDLIVSLDPKDAQLRLAYTKSKFNAAQAAYNSIQKKLEVHKKLFEAGAIIKSKFEEVELETKSAEYQLETTKSEMRLAENELNKTSLYATKDGVMGPREAEEGEFTTPQDKIGSLLETSEVLVEVGVVERDINKIKTGQKAAVYVDAYPNISFTGSVDSIFPVVEGKSRTLTVKIKVANPQGLLFPGMFSRAEILIIQLKDALIVPTTTLISAGQGITLIPAIPAGSVGKTEDEAQTGVVQLRQVKLGYVTSDYAQVTHGLSAQDLVVIETTQGELKDNTRVRIMDIEEMTF